MKGEVPWQTGTRWMDCQLEAKPGFGSAQLTWVAPMLATLTNERFLRPGWLCELNLDGERCLAFRHGCDLRLFSRSRKRLNEKYPEIAVAFHLENMDSFLQEITQKGKVLYAPKGYV
jgi:ATP-dependent DNA ligase